jgi:hypothetical protein
LNETIFVLGLGETLKFFKDFDSPKIGVNDIWSRIKTEIVVCIDRPEKFTPSRLSVIKSCSPKIFFSYLNDWRDSKKESYYWKASIKGVQKGEIFKEGVIYHSVHSPFVACNIAYLLGAKNIVMYGVDFMSHSKLKGANAISKIVSDFTWLNENFKQRGVNLYIGHSASRLSETLPVWPRKTGPYSPQATLS